ncbi:MAG: metallopeptidase family protein [Ignavibacteria bacterium]|nr:metallopeptidase family protein [Ignavibacteria bacterium]
MRIDRSAFEEMAREAFESLPDVLMQKLENVVVVVEERPSPETSRRFGRGGGILLGLYEGVPLTFRGAHYGSYPVAPDKISLFRQNILRTVRSEEEVPEKIRDVLIHEIAHHFGMDEDEIRDAGY